MYLANIKFLKVVIPFKEMLLFTVFLIIVIFKRN